jgi:hypothetical protein
MKKSCCVAQMPGHLFQLLRASFMRESPRPCFRREGKQVWPLRLTTSFSVSSFSGCSILGAGYGVLGSLSRCLALMTSKSFVLRLAQLAEIVSKVGDNYV